MNTYFIGTTSECAKAILSDGLIKRTPPHRVWEDYSEDYVYLVPKDQNDEDDRDTLGFAFEQAGFAVYELDHSYRAVLVIEGIDESLLTVDSDSKGIGGVKYPLDIPVENIKAVYIDNNTHKDEVKKYICLTKLFDYQNKSILNSLEDLVWDEDLEDEDFFASVPLKHIDKFERHELSNDGNLEFLYDDFRESLELEISPQLYEQDEFFLI